MLNLNQFREVANNSRHFFMPQIQNLVGFPPGSEKWVIRYVGHRSNRPMHITIIISFYQFTGDWNFRFGLFRQADPDRISQPVLQECTNTNCRLDAAVLSFSRFRHTQVEGIIHSFCNQSLDQQTVSLNHDLGIAGFHGKDNIIIIFILGDPQKLHS